MGYVGEGSVGGDGVGGEPMRRAPGQIVKMGGKPKKGGAKEAAGTGGVDGRGKGEDNWIGGQKTRRQVKVSSSSRVSFPSHLSLFSVSTTMKKKSSIKYWMLQKCTAISIIFLKTWAR